MGDDWLFDILRLIGAIFWWLIHGFNTKLIDELENEKYFLRNLITTFLLMGLLAIVFIVFFPS